MNNYLIIITAGSKLDVSIIELNFHVDKQIEIDGCTYTVKSSTDDISLGFIDWFYDHEHALVGIEIIPRDPSLARVFRVRDIEKAFSLE